MSDEWAGLVNTQINEYLPEVEDGTLRNRKLMALLKSKGRISMGHHGLKLDWKVKYKRTPMSAYADMDTLTFSRLNRWQTAQLDWRGYSATDMLTKRDKEVAKSTTAIVKIFSELAENLASDIEDEFPEELWLDGNATGRTKCIHGFESFLADDNTELTNSPVFGPSDTYAGLLTALANYGGNWSTSGGSTEWPSGRGDSHYDFFSPVIVNVASTRWQSSTKTWPNTCREALRYGLIKGRRNKSKKGMIDVVMMDNEWFRNLCDKLELQERTMIQRGGKDSLLELGFASDVVMNEGIEHTWEYGIPSLTAYGIPTGTVELCSLQDKLFKADGPDYDIATKSYRISIDFLGNLKTSTPRGWVKWR